MGRFAAAASQAKELTDSQLATELAALGTLTRDDIEELLPKRGEKDAFLALMREVESEKSEDEKLAYLRKNLETAGKVAIKVLKALV